MSKIESPPRKLCRFEACSQEWNKIKAKDGVDAFQQLTTKAKIKQPVGKTLCKVDKIV